MIIRIAYFFFFTILIFGCQSENNNQNKVAKTAYQKLSGQTMGTTYNLTVKTDEMTTTLYNDIDKLLDEINYEVNTYFDSSLITLFNQSLDGITFNNKFVSADSPNRHFLMNYYLARQIHDATNGNFDPTIMPFVQYWGFGREKRPVNNANKKIIDSLIQFVGMDKVSWDESTRRLSKTAPGVSLDFSAIAKGYAVDAFCELLERKGIKDYFVEIGGEVRAKGKNPRGQTWVVGIATPDPAAKLTDLKAQVKLYNMALASSGNYRNFYETNGRKYGHTLDPKTGMPKSTDLLSASIFAEDCMTADAYATACMVMGLKDALELIESTEGLEAYFIYGNEEGEMEVKYTDGVKGFLVYEK